jgi:hypothetical protein
VSHVLRIVAGRRAETPIAAAAVSRLAIRLRDTATGHGLRLRRFEASRIRGSQSRYLHLIDGDGREWILRVSSHHRPARTGHLIPHLDFVSLDGASGLDRAAEALRRIGAGDIAWWPPSRSRRRKGVR